MHLDLSLPHLQDIIWRWLDAHPGRHPRVADVAAALGVTELKLRRELQRRGRGPARDLITYFCLTHAKRDIKTGMKAEAAMCLSGLRNKTNYSHQCQDFLGCLPHDLRKASNG
jgi:AraC-like DNA-binding protein